MAAGSLADDRHVDRSQWEPLFGARWQQRGGRIVVDGLGAGFGGRSLLLAKADAPQLPYELAVSVKLDDEAGAAGLVFHADGGERHYGFYPSAGKLRLSRFEGPDVFSWKVLAEKPSDALPAGGVESAQGARREGQAAVLCQRRAGDRIERRRIHHGRVGLAKFRNTGAEFRRFAVQGR